MSDPATRNNTYLQQIQELLNDPGNVSHLLRSIVEQLLRENQKLERQLDKISKITDRYQIQLKETNIKLDEAARTDLLTGLSNRRDISERIEEEICRVQRSSYHFSILVLDIDHFKKVNDTYGHLLGDLVLQQMARAFKTSLRTTDLCARWGGEEFLILLPYTDAEGAQVIAERLRSSIANYTFGNDKHPLSLTVSIGGTNYAPGKSIDMLLCRADKMLYKAKRKGRNQVIISVSH